MTLPQDAIKQLAELSDFAESLANEAGSILRQHFRGDFQQEIKSDNTPVTEIDRQVETALRNLIQARYPDHTVIGEEFGQEAGQSAWQWVIDPIDGTRAFIAGRDTFVTLIALCWKNKPVLGLIDQPIRHHRWVGAQGHNTRFNGNTITHQKLPQQLAEATLGTTDTSLFPPEAIPRFEALKAACGNLRLGGDGYFYGLVSSGEEIQIVCEHGLKAHDFAALIPVLEHAGAIVTDWQGKPITLQSDGTVLAATSTVLHAQALQQLTA